MLSILVARLPAQGRTVWPVARPARLPAEARLSRQAGQLARIIESGSGGVHLLAAETNLRTSHEKALPLCDKSADSATKNTTQSSAAAGAPSARPSSDHGVVNPDRVLTDWRRGVNREERVQILHETFIYVNSKLGDKIGEERKVAATKHLEDCEFRRVAFSFDLHLDLSTHTYTNLQCCSASRLRSTPTETSPLSTSDSRKCTSKLPSTTKWSRRRSGSSKRRASALPVRERHRWLWQRRTTNWPWWRWPHEPSMHSLPRVETLSLPTRDSAPRKSQRTTHEAKQTRRQTAVLSHLRPCP